MEKVFGIQKPTGIVRKEQNLGIKNVTDNYLGEKTQILPHSQAQWNGFKIGWVHSSNISITHKKGAKLLKVRQIRNEFSKPTFLPNNERTNSNLLLVDLLLFVFWKKVKTPKRHFEIN